MSPEETRKPTIACSTVEEVLGYQNVDCCTSCHTSHEDDDWWEGSCDLPGARERGFDSMVCCSFTKLEFVPEQWELLRIWSEQEATSG